jgi:YidC/Oxa1 family membrane protein insertase
LEKNVIVAVVLSLIVLVAFNIFVSKYYNVPSEPKGDKGTRDIPAKREQGIDTSAQMKVPLPATTEVPQTPSTGVEEQDVIIETPLFKGIVTSRGGSMKSWELTSYRETIQKNSPPIDVLSLNGSIKYPFEVSIIDPFSGLEERLILTPSRERLILEKGEKGEVVLSGITSNGLNITERLHFTGDNYAVDMNLEVTNRSSQPYNGIISLSLIGSTKAATQSSRWYGHVGPVTYINNEIERDDVKKILEEEKQYEGDILWFAMEEKYFMTSIIPSTSNNTKLRINTPSPDFLHASFLIQDPLAPQQVTAHNFTLYVGPKEINTLRAIGRHLEEIINFGYFAFIAKPLLIVLNFFYSFLSNYALAIILLTALIKVVFYPLTKTSLKSMKEMQKIQPQMAAIRKKFKDNKEKMNKEIMELYKRNKVNPLGGCLPMILQIPVFIALYNVLLNSIELRHAPFILWITDLSQPDRLGSFPIPFVTPPGIPVLTLLMGGSMLLQQKMSPTAMDPQQAKMMMLMPLFFTFMFINFPSGLVLYWLVNNILQIGQQYYIQKKG